MRKNISEFEVQIQLQNVRGGPFSESESGGERKDKAGALFVKADTDYVPATNSILLLDS